MRVLGISGTNGSGKDAIAKFIENNYGFLFVSVSDLLRDEAKKRNLPIERSVLRSISKEWREISGLGCLVDKAVELYQAGARKKTAVVVVSIRNPGEVERIKQLGGLVIWVDADPKVRYERVSKRTRSSEDKKSYSLFLKEERDEMTSSGTASALDMKGVKNMSDIYLENNYQSIDELNRMLPRVLDGYLKVRY